MIGNSYIQADAIDPRDTLTERLGANLHMPAYAVDVDGFSLADYLVAAHWASPRLDAHTLLVLLTAADLKHSCVPRLGQHCLRSSDGVISLALVERQSPSGLKGLLNDSSLFRYIFDNLRVSASWAKGWRRNPDEAPSPDASAGGGTGCSDEEFERATTSFLLK